MNRVHVLKESLPAIIKAAKESPPTEVVIVNYSSTDDLEEYISTVDYPVVYKKLDGKKYYNSAHARNLCVQASNGEYIIQLSTDALPKNYAFTYIRNEIDKNKPIWMIEESHTYWIYGFYAGRFLVCKRDEFISSGGYDERFNVYAPEDKDICNRLTRRNGKPLLFPNDLIGEIYTPNDEKLKNLDNTTYEHRYMLKKEMADRMKIIYNENIVNKVLVANEGKDWSKWI